jgi:hypothetical protein
MLIISSIHFHSILVELFRPFVVDSPLSAVRAPRFAIKAYSASCHQLRATIYHYATTYGGPPVSAYLMSSLLSVVYSTMPDLDNLQSRFFFSFTIKFLGALSDQFPIIRYIMQGIYQSANQAGNTLPQEAIDILQEQVSRLNHSESLHGVQSSYPVDMNRSLTDLEGARLSNLIKSTKEFALKD